MAESTPPPVPYAEHEREVLEVITERDSYHEWADELAHAIAEATDVAIGEHTSENNPWRNALDAARGLAASLSRPKPPPADKSWIRMEGVRRDR